MTEDSARGGHAAETIYIDSNHSGLNKCQGLQDELYMQLNKSLANLNPYVPLDLTVLSKGQLTGEELPSQHSIAIRSMLLTIYLP